MALYNQGGNLVGGSVDISSTQPTGRTNGSLWIDNSNNILYQLISGTYTQVYPVTAAGITDGVITTSDVSGTAAITQSQLSLIGTGFPSSPILGQLYSNTNHNRIWTCVSTAQDANRWRELTSSFLGWEFDFTTYDQTAFDAAWIPVDTAKVRGNPTNDNIAFNLVQDASNDSLAYDFGAGNISNTAWVLRFSLNFTTLTQSASMQSWIILSSTAQTGAANSAQDFIGVDLDMASGANKWGVTDGDGQNPGTVGSDSLSTATFTTGTTYYVQIVRSSATAYAVSIYSDSTYTTLIETVAGTVASSTDTLRYLKISNDMNTSTGVCTGTLDNVRLFNGVTSI